MERLVKSCGAACGLLIWSAVSTAALAQSDVDKPSSAFEVSANSAVVSDYRFRGISLSDRGPAIQGGLDISHKSGFFAGTWASSIADYGGSSVELDLYGGYAGQAVGLNYSLSALGYFYPGGTGVNYLELRGTAGKTVGPAALEVEVAWVPNQNNYPGNNLYVGAEASVAVLHTPLTLKVRGGRESSAFLTKWDWEVGVACTFGKVTGSVAYVDSDYDNIEEAGRLGAGGVVATLRAEF